MGIGHVQAPPGGRRWLPWLLSFLLVLVLVFAYLSGLSYNVVVVLPIAGAVTSVVSRLWRSRRAELEFGLLARRVDPRCRPYVWQCVNRWLLCGLLAVVAIPAVIPIQFSAAGYRGAIALLTLSLTVFAAVALIPKKRISRPVNLLTAAGSLLLILALVSTYRPPVNATLLGFPAEGEWYVFHGGRNPVVNHHYAVRSQRHALDLLKTIDGRTYAGNRDALDSYAAYGEPILAPADGQVVRVVSDLVDQPIGKSDREHPAGNHVVIQISADRFVLLAHLRQHSVSVRTGDYVTRGQRIGACGNSGNTSEPHLHVQVQDKADLDAPGIRSYPILFEAVTLQRGGNLLLNAVVDARRNDRITR